MFLEVAKRFQANRRVEHGERLVRRARIILGDGFSPTDCITQDISPRGARFTVLKGIAIPRTPSLTILNTGRTRQAVRRRQRGPGIGVKFAAEAAAGQDNEQAI